MEYSTPSSPNLSGNRSAKIYSKCLDRKCSIIRALIGCTEDTDQCAGEQLNYDKCNCTNRRLGYEQCCKELL